MRLKQICGGPLAQRNVAKIDPIFFYLFRIDGNSEWSTETKIVILI